jgi:two-component system, NtrC family, sensor kinase
MIRLPAPEDAERDAPAVFSAVEGGRMSLPLPIRQVVTPWLRPRVHRRSLAEFSRSLALIADRGALVASVVARLRELFDSDRVLLLELAAGSERLTPALAVGLRPDELTGIDFSPRGRLARWLTANESCLDLRRHPGVFSYLEEREQNHFTRLRIGVCAPLISLHRLNGLILLGSDRPAWRLTRSDLKLLELLAGQASLALENADLYRAQCEQLDQLHRAERLAAVGQLAAGIAHEIRNPLTAIRSTVQYLLQSVPMEDPKRELVCDPLGEVDRINGTISDLLTLSRTGQVSQVEIDLLEPLSSAVELVEAHARERGIALRWSTGEAATRQVAGDAAQLRQVFLNLLFNAIQAMPDGGLIQVGIGRWDGPTLRSRHRFVEVQIVDQGCGIPLQHLSRVFEPFFTARHEGTGLGLAICKSIIEQHDGEIHLESREGIGTTAFVRLPAAEFD